MKNDDVTAYTDHVINWSVNPANNLHFSRKLSISNVFLLYFSRLGTKN